MDQRASSGRNSRVDQIRRLGYDPDHLTVAEQAELLVIHGWSTRERKPLGRLATVDSPLRPEPAARY